MHNIFAIAFADMEIRRFLVHVTSTSTIAMHMAGAIIRILDL